MIVPIKRVIRNKRLLSLLESQYSSRTELGVEPIDVGDSEGGSFFRYRVYTRKGNEDWSRDRFVIRGVKRGGKIREYSLDGKVYFNQ